MRKLMFVTIVLALTVALAAVTASAQTSIAFGNGGSGSTGSVTFTANGGGTASLDLGSCTGSPEVCTLSGSNTGGGTYSFTTTDGPSDGDIQVGGFIASSLNRSITGPSSSFSFTGGVGNLSGTVVWNSLITDGIATITGTLTITSSTISGLPSGRTALIDFNTNHYANDLSTFIFAGAAGATESATLSAGQVVVAEPSSLLLLGSGLLSFGGILRRRILVARCPAQ